MKRLIEIQKELKAPKSQFNSYGNFYYRSCEDILGALKPLLEPRNLVILLNDEIVFIESRFYVKATATLWDTEVNKELIHTTAYAREEESKKGMDGSQVTGASSTYARKYALNGLLAIDDVKDSDTTNKGDDKKKSKDEPFVPDIIKNKETDDTDIYLGLSETVDTKSALKYFNEYKDKVNDKAAFTQAWKDHIKTFGKKEE